MEKAIVLLSGGMDSAVTLYIAKQDHDCRALIFDYGQKAAREIDSAHRVAAAAGVKALEMTIAMPWKGSALLDAAEAIPTGAISGTGEIPTTYVPARNIVFLSFAVSFAEASGAGAVFIGAHQLDYSNYPDCRGEFFECFQRTVDAGTKSGVEGRGVKIITPVLDFTKKEIVAEGVRLGVPFGNTWSCYHQGEGPCGTCESCLLRAKAFAEAGIADPLTVNSGNNG